ncbi:hypothetical protein GCM10015536_04230 [Streptomyces griseomycini]|nr:hypothetical protein GCM10015536_04230 [Streptomyces griseomycini]
MAEDAQGDAAGAPPAGLRHGGPHQGPAGPRAARLPVDDEAVDPPDVRVGRDRCGEAEADVADGTAPYSATRCSSGP